MGGLRHGPERILELDASGSATHLVSRRYAWGVFAMTFGLALTDFIDRQIIVSAFPYLKAQWRLSDAELGALVSIVAVTVALGSLPIARLADRWGRAKSIAVMGTLWSLATLGCAFSGNYAQLAAARAAIGVGEAGYGPAGGALLSSLFPQRLRSTVIGALQAAGPLGVVFGVLLGGLLSARWGWRVTLGVFAVPGLLIAVLFLRVRDYRTPAAQHGAPATATNTGRSGRSAWAALFRSRTANAAYLGGALQLVVLSTLFTWLPSYLTRTYGYTVTHAGAVAAVVITASAVGTVVLGYVADRVGTARPCRKLLVPTVLGLVTTAVLTTAFAWVPAGNLQLCLITAGAFTVTSAIGPVPAVVIDVVDPAVRATALGMVALVQNLLGLAVGPLLTGVLSDAYGLPTALAVMSLSCAAGALALGYASRTYEKDLHSADSLAKAAAAPGGDLSTAAL